MNVNLFRAVSYPNLVSKIRKKQALIGIVGIGYVGQALVEGMSISGIKSYGFDIDKEKPKKIKDNNFTPADTIDQLNNCEVICICVPTPVTG